nr:MAG TPA: hypothetical protein [Caudoviricetes sp.]
MCTTAIITTNELPHFDHLSDHLNLSVLTT